MASKVLDVALDQIGKRYPSFKSETGKRVVDTLSDAYKSYQKRRPGMMGDVKSELAPSAKEPESHALIEIPKETSSSKKSDPEKRDSFYENFKEYIDDNKSPTTTTCPTQKFPNEAPKSDRIQIEEDTNGPNNQRLSDNPPASPDNGGGYSEKNQLDPQNATLPGQPKPPEGPAVRNDISQYLQKKSLAQGMMDLALLSANTNQLRYILDSSGENAYYNVSLTLIVTSLVLQIVVGLMLVWNSSYNVQRKSGFASADKINNLSVFGVFLITLINVFVSTFGNVPSASSSTATTTPKIEGAGSETSSVTTPLISASSSTVGPPIDLMPPPAAAAPPDSMIIL